MSRLVRLLCLLALAATGVHAQGPAASGRVIAVHDGDTVTVVRGAASRRVRLDGIDAPELAQPFGTQAHDFTRQLLLDQTVRVDERDVDADGRLVARLQVAGRDASLTVVAAGLAWHFVRYSSDDLLARAERDARFRRLGLWAAAAPVAPWEFRATLRARAAVPSPAGPYRANVSSLVFHAAACPNATCKNCTRVFTRREDAVRAGFRPAGDCRP
jgi:endonuclease YncB( thermonuclease family)